MEKRGVVMKFLKIMLFCSLLFSVSGCSGKVTGQTYFYKQNNYTVGSKGQAIETIVFTKKTKSGALKRIIFYIDTLPYDRKFDLCRDSYRDSRKEIEHSGKKVEDSVKDCKSHVYLNKKGKGYIVDYSIKLPISYRLNEIGRKIYKLEAVGVNASRVIFPYVGNDEGSSVSWGVQTE